MVGCKILNRILREEFAELGAKLRGERVFSGQIAYARTYAYCRKIGSKDTLRRGPGERNENVDIIYTDVWVSMGEPDEVWEKRISDLTPYRVTDDIMKNAAENAVFMHCPSAFHDLNTGIGRQIYDRFKIDCMEVTDSVFSSGASIVFDQAENRMHTIKAVIAASLA